MSVKKWLLDPIRRLRARWNADLTSVTLISLMTAILFSPLMFGYTFSMVGAHMYAQYPWTVSVPAVSDVWGRGYDKTDQAEWVYPTSVFVTEAVRKGEAPLWLPYNFAGVPAMTFDMIGFRYPLRWPLFFLLSPIRQHDFLLVIHLLMAGLGMYALLRCLGTGALGAMFGAFVWELNGYVAYFLVFEHLPAAAAWLPFTLLGATLAVRRLSFWWAIGAGIAAGCFILSGYLHFVYFGGLVLTCWYGGMAIGRARLYFSKRDWRKFLRCLSLPVCSLIVGMTISASLWLSFISALSTTHRDSATLESQLREGMSLMGLLEAQTLKPELSFVGLTALILAAIAVFRRRSAIVISSLALFIISVGICVGFPPLYRLFRATLPFFGTFHATEGLFPLFLSAAILSGFGLNEVILWRSASQGHWRRWIVYVLAAVPCLQLIVISGEAFTRLAPGLKMTLAVRLPEFHQYLRTFRPSFPQTGTLKLAVAGLLIIIALFAIVVLAKRLQSRKSVDEQPEDQAGARRLAPEFLMVLATAFTLVVFTWSINPIHPARPEWLYPVTPLISALQKLPKDRRILPVNQRMPKGEWRQPMLYGKTPAIFGLRSGSGYENLLPEHVARLWLTVQSKGIPVYNPLRFAVRTHVNHDRTPIGLLEKLSVGYLVTQPGVEPLDVSGANLARDGTLKLIYQGDDGWIYEYPRALPRAFLAPGIVSAPDSSSALKTLCSPEFDARQAVIAIGDAPADYRDLSSGAASSEFRRDVKIINEGINDVEIQVETDRPGVLVLNDSWDDDWKAYIDGAEQPVLRANYAFRGVKAPSGKYVVAFRYRPKLLLTGLILSATSLAILTGCLAVVCFRRLMNERGRRQV